MIDFKGLDIVLVGNSAHLLEQQMGSVIDAFPVVVRMNRGYTHTLEGEPINEKALGVRTDYWGCSLKDHFSNASNHFKDAPCIFVNCKLYDKIPSYHPAGFIFNNKENYYAFKNDYPHDRPSTGLLMIDFLLRSCANVGSLTLIGFDFFESESWPNQGWFLVPHSGADEKAYIDQNYDVRIIP